LGINLESMTTETRNPDTMDLDRMTALEVVTAMNREDAKVPAAIAAQLPSIAQVAEWAIASLEAGGRVFYMGAGTSGRLGVLDAAECPPTFGVAPDRMVGLIAGGEKAFLKAVEGAEDSRELGREDLTAWGLEKRDLVIGIAASGRPPYGLGGLASARERQARAEQAAAYEAVGAWEYIGECVITAYCPCGECCGKWSDGVTASGLPAGPGIVAVDPAVIELGSTVIIDGQQYLAADTGVTGQAVDLCMEEHEAAQAFGVRTAEVWVIPAEKEEHHD